MIGEWVCMCEKAKDQPSFTSASLLINGWGRGALHVLLLQRAWTLERERERDRQTDGRKERRVEYGKSVNDNHRLVCKHVSVHRWRFNIWQGTYGVKWSGWECKNWRFILVHKYAWFSHLWPINKLTFYFVCGGPCHLVSFKQYSGTLFSSEIHL